MSTRRAGRSAADRPTASAVVAERLRRQCMLRPAASEKRYLELFRSLQPVSPPWYSRPGSPPSLYPRTRVDDSRWADRLRRDRRIVKGRFCGGTLAYVFADDLPVYANAFRRPLGRTSADHTAVMEAVRQQGPISARQLRGETGLLSKRIGPALQRLQQAFLVYEDQVDDGWDRPWYDFSTQWPSVSLTDDARPEAVASVVGRFLWAHVFATFEQIAAWSELPKKDLHTAVGELERRKSILPMTVDGLGQGWVHSEAPARRDVPPPEMVAMLHKADFLARSHRTELARRYAGREVLQYLLVDGAFLGAVLGHWRIGPHEVEDIAVELPAAERERRKEAILAEVRRCYGGPSDLIRRYAGKRRARLAPETRQRLIRRYAGKRL